MGQDLAQGPMRLQSGNGPGLGSVALPGARRCHMSKLSSGRGSQFIHRLLKSTKGDQVEAFCNSLRSQAAGFLWIAVTLLGIDTWR